MKTIKILSIFFSFYSALISSQTIINIDGFYQTNIPNAYYKDVNSKLNQFEGTWVLDNGIYYVKFVFVKKTHATIWNHYEDYLVGEMEVKKNGVNLINTLSNLNTNLADPRDYNIGGNFLNYSSSPFYQYTTDNFRLEVSIIENNCLSEMQIRTLSLNGNPAIQIFKRKPIEIQQTPCTPAIPSGFYYLIKQ